MKWIKAEERLPEGRVITRWHHAGNPEWERIDILDKQQIESFDTLQNSSVIPTVEWLDESPSGADSSVLVKALQRIAKGDTDCEDCDSAFQFLTEIAHNALAQYNAVEPEKDQDDAFIKKHVAIIKEKILENSIQIKMQHLQRPPMDASVKYFLEKGTVSGNFMLAIKDIIFGLPKMIQEELMAQTPRTPISQPGKLDTVGEHPSDKEGEGEKDEFIVSEIFKQWLVDDWQDEKGQAERFAIYLDKHYRTIEK